MRAVIFDMDGILIDTERWLNKYWCQAALEAGFAMKPEHALAIRSLDGKLTEPYLQSIFGEEFDYQAIRNHRRELFNAHIEKYGVDKKPGVDEILDYLKEKGIKAAVATATEPVRAKEYLTAIGVYEKFDKVISAKTVKNGKPAPDVYLFACEELGEKPEDCFAVEDSPNGIMSAYRAGLRVVMVPDLTEPDEETAKLLTKKVSKLDEMIPFLEEELKS